MEGQMINPKMAAYNEKRGFGWDKNPFVWCITFKAIK